MTTSIKIPRKKAPALKPKSLDEPYEGPPRNLEEAWATERRRLLEWPRGGAPVWPCDLFTIHYRGETYYRIVVSSRYPSSYGWPVFVAFPKYRQARLGSTHRIEFGIAQKGEKVHEWRPLGDFPAFNESHRQEGVGDYPDYCVMTADWVPVPATAQSMSTRRKKD